MAPMPPSRIFERISYFPSMRVPGDGKRSVPPLRDFHSIRGPTAADATGPGDSSEHERLRWPRSRTGREVVVAGYANPSAGFGGGSAAAAPAGNFEARR